MSRKKKKADDGIDPNAWLSTYGDMVTLLLTFFVLLYSMSTIDSIKFKSISSALQSVMSGQQGKTVLEFHMNDGEVPMVGMPIPTTQTPNGGEMDEEQMYQNMIALIEENNMEDVIEIKTDSRGYIFELKDKILFESGKAELKKESKPILDVITKYIAGIANEIIIEGHTDNVPIHNMKYADNWDLSASRANTVTRYFTKSKELDPARFKPMGLGEYSPIVNNDTIEHRAMNRRVNILIVTNSNEEDGEE